MCVCRSGILLCACSVINNNTPYLSHHRRRPSSCQFCLITATVASLSLNDIITIASLMRVTTLAASNFILQLSYFYAQFGQYTVFYMCQRAY